MFNRRMAANAVRASLKEAPYAGLMLTVIQEGLHSLRRHGRRSRGGDQHGPPELALNETSPPWLLTLQDQLFALLGERNIVAWLQMQGFAKASGYDQLAFGLDPRGRHGQNLTRLTTAFN